MKLTVDVSCDRFVNAVSQLAQENSFDPPGWARKIRPMLRFVLFKRKWFKNPKITGYFHGQAQCRRYFYRELGPSWFCFGLFLTWPFDQLWLANIERDVILSSLFSKLFPVFQLPGGAGVDIVQKQEPLWALGYLIAINITRTLLRHVFEGLKRAWSSFFIIQ